MARSQHDILVKIRVLLEGLGNVRALAGHMKELNGGGGRGQAVALAGDLDKLSAAVDRLATAQEKASSKGGFVRFLVGVSAVVNTLSNIPQAFAGITKLLDFFDSIGGTVGAALGKVKETASSLFSSASQFASGAGAQAGAALSGLGGAASGLGAALGAALPIIGAAALALAALMSVVLPLAVAVAGLAGAVGLGVAALFKIAPAGIAANRQLELVRLGIAAVITSLAGLKVDGVPVDGAEKFGAAMQVAGDQLEKLRVDAVNTVATFEQIAPAFQAAIGPGLAAGLTLDQVRETTVKVVQAAGAIGLPLHQINQEVRAILEGSIDINARLAKTLGISAEDVKLWKEKGTLAEELNKRLAGFATAGEEAAQTLDGLTSNLQEALNVFSAEATRRAFGALKAEFARLLPQLFDFKNAGIAAQFKSLAELADDVLVRVIRIGGSIAQSIVSGLKKAADFVEQNKATINDILNLVELVVRQFLQGAGVLARVATDTSTWKSLLESVRGVLLLINLALSLMVDELRKAEPLLRLAALAGAALLAASPTLAALSQGSAGGPTEAQRALSDLEAAKAGLSPEELRRRGFTSNIEVTGLPRPSGGGGKTKATKHDQLRDLTHAAEDAALGTDRARVERAYNLAKDFLERQSSLIEEKLNERLLTIEQYYVDEERIQREAIDAEKAKLNELFRLQEEDLKRKKARVDADPDKDLSARAREKKKEALDEEFKQAVIPIAERLAVLDRERLELADKIALKRRDELKTFRQMLDEVNESLALETGDTDGAVEAARARIDAANKEGLERTARQRGADSTEFQQAVQLVEVLKKKAEYQLRFNQLKQQQDALDFAEDRIRADVERGLISEKDGREQVISAQKRHKEAVKETIAAMRELAIASGDPALILAAERAAAETADLGRKVDETARRINDSLRTGLEQTFADIITRTKGIKEAFSDLAQHMLALIAQILAKKFVEKIFGSFLKGGGEDDEDDDGGGGGFNIGGAISSFFGSIFGRATGGFEGATPGGRVIRVAEAGFDEVILTTDPKHKGRTSRLLGQFLRRTGLAPDFGAVALEGALAGVPSFAAGGFALEDITPPELAGGDTYNVKVSAQIQTTTPQAFRGSEAEIRLKLSRATMDGVRRAKSRPKV